MDEALVILEAAMDAGGAVLILNAAEKAAAEFRL